MKTVLEEELEEEMSEHLRAGYRELTSTRRGEHNGHYTRNLVTPSDKIERLTVPPDREGKFVTGASNVTSGLRAAKRKRYSRCTSQAFPPAR